VSAALEQPTAEERYEALSFADGDDLERVADRILADGASVQVVAGPEVASAPVRLRIPGTSSTAVIGHVALTNCTVVLDGARGDGCRQGRDLPGAVAAAVCDAEAERRGEHGAVVDELARRALADRAATARTRGRMVGLTRIDEGV
jgi:alpha-D-ribose 1-methylphosphonate 5-triphosphate synthase subunit PhnG